ncbi:hypothetical protein NIES2135_42570 [Leptolyngbya boryana NIES-2135]|uniref:Uncharacterized protein n=1 Tax=Leptolyngbya boryana NIES-2135 TaxID=1973484 RepID=A0A1Z4JKV7_LEPBY|nr:hypothetical protein NIES2135_42570 [Leptolyngbya boryana NIES-2135]
MCQLCGLAARYARVRQDSLVQNLSQFATVIQTKASTETKPNQPVTNLGEN